MLDKLLNLEDGQRIIDMQFLMRGSQILLAVLLVAAVIYTIFYYRSVRSIPSKGRKLMGLCHLLALVILIVIIAMPAAKVRYTKTYRPTMLILVDTSRSMAVNDKRVTAEALAEAAKILGQLPLDEEVTADTVQQFMGKSDDMSRLDLVKALFEHPDIDLLRRAGKRFDLRFFSFDQGLAPEGGAEDAAAWLQSREANGDASRIGTAVQEAVSRYTGLHVAGVMVFSDFGWVDGEDPARVAAEMEKRGVPVYAIPIGLPAPPDAMIAEIIAPDAVFQDDPASLRVRIQSRGLEGQSTTLKMKVNGVEEQFEPVVFEDGAQFVELHVQPKQSSGSLQLDFELEPADADSNPKNNTRQHSMRIIEEKIKVLYVEGMPRWEFRYLRWILLRNRHLQTRFLMTRGDPNLAKISPHFMAEFPKDVRNIFEYDLIILGDVSSKYFKPEQLELLEAQIKEHGGSLIVLAGSVSTPSSYQDTPVQRILPVDLGVGKPLVIGDNQFPRLPETEVHSPITVLDDDADINQRIWSKVRDLGQLPSLDGPKASANVLLHLPSGTAGAPNYPVVSWHNYGDGKCMFVATDRLWRLRLEVGDVHHARFWGQAIQFLTMSRLLGQNKRISLQTERTRYNPGEPIRIFANVLSETYEPVVKESHTVVVERRGFADSVQQVVLISDPATPGVYFGSLPAGQDGEYVLRAQDHEAEISGTVDFSVAADPLEDRDTSANPTIAQNVADASGGSVVGPGELAGLVDSLPAPEMSRIVSRELELWDTPLLYLLLVLLVGVEWSLRRRENLL
jgi:hypothetical protein